MPVTRRPSFTCRTVPKNSRTAPSSCEPASRNNPQVPIGESVIQARMVSAACNGRNECDFIAFVEQRSERRIIAIHRDSGCGRQLSPARITAQLSNDIGPGGALGHLDLD